MPTGAANVNGFLAGRNIGEAQRRRVQKLTALLRLALARLRTSGSRLTGKRLPDGRAKMRILRAADRAREYLPLRACGSYVSRPVGSMPGVGGSTRVRSMISPPAPAHRRLD